MTVLIDCRSRVEFRSGHIEGSIHVSVGEIEQKIESVVPNKDTPIQLYCLSGGRADYAKQLLDQKGYISVKNLGAIEEACAILNKGLVKD